MRRRPPRRARGGRAALALLLASALLLGGGALAGARAGWLAGKAQLAQHLLERAWQERRASGRPARPWPWADISPAARLHVPHLARSLVVLQDASGEAMAFGPGLVAGSPGRAARESVALGGHRDSHLAFLEDLPIGAALILESADGMRHRYRLARTRVVDASRETLGIARDAPGLVLITCYPFRATQTGGPLRYVAIAVPDVPAAGTSVQSRS